MDIAICKGNNGERERERGRLVEKGGPCGLVAYGRPVVASSLNTQRVRGPNNGELEGD